MTTMKQSTGSNVDATNQVTRISPASASGLGSTLRNPLVVFGLVLLAGDGPLVVAYAFSSDPTQSWALLIALLGLTLGMATFFCYLVAFKPRHLYAPGEIPPEAIGMSIFSDGSKTLIFPTEIPAHIIEQLDKDSQESAEQEKTQKPYDADLLRWRKQVLQNEFRASLLEHYVTWILTNNSAFVKGLTGSEVFEMRQDVINLLKQKYPDIDIVTYLSQARDTTQSTN